jgi:hypothetical protein
VLPIDDQSAQRALEALNQAALAIASELDVDKVLQLIVDSARDLARAQSTPRWLSVIGACPAPATSIASWSAV